MDIKSFLIPFPFLLNSEPSNGTLVEMPERCITCKNKSCADPRDNNLVHTCSYGFNFIYLKTVVVCGFICSDNNSQQSRKRKKEYPNNVFNLVFVQNFIRSFQYYEKEMEREYSESKNLIINSYIQEEKYKDDFLDILKPEIIKGLSHVHDFKQIISTIRQHINIIIEKGYRGKELADKLEQATFNERAIYHASQLLSEKLNISKFLLSTDWKYDKNSFRSIQFHKLIVKYVRIYKSEYEKKRLQVHIRKESYNCIKAHPEALSIIPHTLIDNAIKYSPRESEIIIEVEDLTEGICFSVKSYGPKIELDERGKIFDPFYRGKDAIKSKSEGSGYGLFISQQIAINHFDTKIIIEQNKKINEKKGAYNTIFSITLPLFCNVY